MPQVKKQVKTRGDGKLNRAVKEAVEFAFNKVNGSNSQGLIELSKSNPAIFYSLVAKCIPAAVAVSVTHQFDLGEAMMIASERAARLNKPDTPNTIEHIPDDDDTLAHDTLQPNVEAKDDFP
tara:strand:+ start:228 stop:593 length:366 start_codon:yes stop_codon:yes gene_type:complete